MIFRFERYVLHQPDMAQQLLCCGNILSKNGKLWQLVASQTGVLLFVESYRGSSSQKWQKNGKVMEFVPNFSLPLLSEI